MFPEQVIIGTPPAQAEKCSLSWRLGSCYLYEEVLSAPAVFFMYVMGRAYRGLFQDPNMIRFIPQEACGGGNLAILETLDIEQQSSSIVQRGEGSVRAAAGMLKTEGNGIIWDMEKFANIAQLSGRKLIFGFDGTFLNASISTAAVTMVNLVDSISASASLSGGTCLHSQCCSFCQSFPYVLPSNEIEYILFNQATVGVSGGVLC